ncbi:glycosyltransferase family 4 protein [Desulfosarcina sp. OttesenSCG-928-A07]|nr:glycosyltransferase family 4 protein [Desulfosarcina sp. OttesenSCG-928-G17]MDL2329125.1 glycosyltransferase family 4 protein [Desulfosarcina sp. OttesenSCG-928-A07]
MTRLSPTRFQVHTTPSGLPDRPLKICLLGYRSNPHCGGQGVYLKNLSRALKSIGHSVTVISGPPYPLLSPDIPLHRLPSLDLYNPAHLFRVPSLKELAIPVNFMEWAGVSTMGFPEPFTFGIRAWQFMRHRINAFDIVHDNQSLSYGINAIARRMPTIATIHHPITVDRRIAVRAAATCLGKLKQLRWFSFIGMQKRVARKLKRIITVSECSKKDIAREFRIPENRFQVIPNGIDTDLFHPIAGISREPFRIITTHSSDVPLKGLHYLLCAVAEVSRARPVHLSVVGTPGKAITRLIRDLGIERHVTFTGRITDAEFVRHYAAASMAVVPSVYEGFGLPAGEAMACGVPVISTTGGALPEVVGDAGLLVPPKDAGALAAAITRLLDHPEYASALGQKGYERVHHQFTWTRAAEKTIAAYGEALCDYR